METIVALATAPLKSALALIRVSGDDSFAISSQLFSKSLQNIDKPTLKHGTISDNGKVIDDVVLLCYPAEKSMTGEPVVEVSCHGSMLIANQIINAFLSRGARYAKPGEFTMRAFLNGKMDLIEAEAVNDLINASTEGAKELSLKSLNGQASSLFVPVKERIASLLALLETNIDFPEYEDIEQASFAEVVKECDSIMTELSSLIKQGEEGRIVKEGVKIAILGEPNVGKSSILNALIGEDKAIVTAIPGTTRDIVEGELSIKGIPVKLLDTAGIRESSDEVERIGIDKSLQAKDNADLIVVVLDASAAPNKKDQELLDSCDPNKTIVVYNKADLSDVKDDGKIYISAKQKEVEPLKKAILDHLHLSDTSFLTPSLSNDRQLGLLRKIYASLEQAKADAEKEIGIDLVSSSLLDAYNQSRELLGLDPTLDLTDEIFSRFCVGK